MAENLRDLPGVNEVLQRPDVERLTVRYGQPLVTYAVRTAIDAARRLRQGGGTARTELHQDITRILTAICEESLRPVINATGVVLHTNLGRAPLGDEVMADIARIARGYSNLEFDLEKGERGQRNMHVREILKFLTGAEDVLVVNNNAAGIVLTLSVLAAAREVVVSRGELIEIGGSFRIPNIMTTSGVRMLEVGTTNRTRLSDYEAAVTPEAALLFKAHQSNYAIRGFTESVSAKQLAELAHAHGLLMVYDIGSGLLKPVEGVPAEGEPDVRQAIRDGADLVTFSCDKLLGGPQAGVVAGQKHLIDRLAAAPLMRAVRVGKLTLAGLYSVCRRYVAKGRPVESISALRLMARKPDELKRAAERLLRELEGGGRSARIRESTGHPGGGSSPEVELASYAVEIASAGVTRKERQAFAERLFRRLLRRPTPILGVLREGRFFLDVLTVDEDDIPGLARAVADCARGEGTA